MSDDMNEVVNNVKQGSSWLRILFMIVFCVALYVTGIVVMFVMVAQALFSLFSGEDNRNLRRLGLSITEYVREILHFITYNSEERPFPFAPFPNVPGQDEEKTDSASGGADSTAGKKPARAAAKKKAAAKKSSSNNGAARKTSASKASTSKGSSSDASSGESKDSQ